jgi:hypothetical protein
MLNWRLLTVLFCLTAAVTGCEKSEQYASMLFADCKKQDHRFRHSLLIDNQLVSIQVEPPENSLHKDFPGLWMALHFRLNDGDIITRFIQPRIPTDHWEVPVGHLSENDELSYYFSYIFHNPEHDLQLSVDSEWFQHQRLIDQKVPLRFTLHCQEEPGTEARGVRSQRSDSDLQGIFYPRNKPFSCQAEV